MTQSTEKVTLAIKPLTGTSSGKLQGIVSAVASAGIAKFTSLTILTPGQGYQLIASAQSGLLLASSDSFTVTLPEEKQEDPEEDDDGIIKRISNATGLSPFVIAGIVAACIMAISIGGFLYLREQAAKQVAKAKASKKKSKSAQPKVQKSEDA